MEHESLSRRDILTAQNPINDEFYEARKGRSMDFEALKRKMFGQGTVFLFEPMCKSFAQLKVCVNLTGHTTTYFSNPI